MLEIWQTVFAGLTFAVFVLSATIALVQLRDLRLGYQINSGSALLQSYWTPQFQEWLRYTLFDLSERLKDPAFCEELRHAPVDRMKHPEVYICEYYALIGSYVKAGIMPTRIFLTNGSRDAVAVWDRLRKPIELMREHDSPALYEDFEYLATLCRNWLARNNQKALRGKSAF